MELKQLQVLVMGNGDIICKAKVIGHIDDLKDFLNMRQSIDIDFTEQDIEELRSGEDFVWTFQTKCGQNIECNIYKGEQE